MFFAICLFSWEIYFWSSEKRNKHYLDFTFEQLLENKDLYKGKDPKGYYSINIKLVKALKSEENKVTLENSGNYENFKMTYRNLYEKFLISDEYKNRYEELLKIKGEAEAKKFKYFANIFLNWRKRNFNK